MSDHYQVLGVEKNASQDIINATYRALIKAFHPDVFKGDRHHAEKRTKAIIAAFNVLGDPTQRSAYDKELGLQNTESVNSQSNWSKICEFYPVLAEIERDLEFICEDLSAVFREILLETKAFKEAEQLR